MSERPSKLPKDLERELMPSYQKAVIQISSIVVPTNFEYKDEAIRSITEAVTDLFSALTPEFKDKDWSKTYMFVEFVCSKLITAMYTYEDRKRWPNPEFYFNLVYPLLYWLMEMDARQMKPNGNITCVVSIARVIELWLKGLRNIDWYGTLTIRTELQNSFYQYVRNIGHTEQLMWDGSLRLMLQ